MMTWTTTPVLGSALDFAFAKATLEGKITVAVLLLVSVFSWSVIIRKLLQLAHASRMSRQFFAAYREVRDPMELHRAGRRYPGAPAFALYTAGLEEVSYQLDHHPVCVRGERKLSQAAFDSVRIALEEAAMSQALALEKGMIVLSTAVAGGPFIGLLGTVWGVMDTFAGIAKANAASLTAMAPGVAGALIATVVGLLVAIPAMFAYNFMVTRIRGFTQELDAFSIRLATQIEHTYVDDRTLAEGLSDAVEKSLMKREAAAQSGAGAKL
jgi:biopolymer transport protein TolQ